MEILPFNAVPLVPKEQYLPDEKVEKLFKYLDRPKTQKPRPIEKIYRKHAFQNPMIQFTSRSRWEHLPICGKCERVALYDRRPEDPPPEFKIDPETGIRRKSNTYVTCPECGYHGPSGGIFRVRVREV